MRDPGHPLEFDCAICNKSLRTNLPPWLDRVRRVIVQDPGHPLFHDLEAQFATSACLLSTMVAWHISDSTVVAWHISDYSGSVTQRGFLSGLTFFIGFCFLGFVVFGSFSKLCYESPHDQ